MRQIDLYLDRPSGKFVQGINAANPIASLSVTQNETLDIRIHNAVRNTAVPALTPFVERPVEFSSIRASIGNIDHAPRSGSFKLRVSGQTTTQIDWTSPTTPAEIAAFKLGVLNALKALSNIANDEIVAVDPSDSPAHILYFQWTNARTDEIEVVEVKLLPWIAPLVTPGQTAAGYTQSVKLSQAPFVIATAFEREDAPLPTIVETRPGAVGTNAEQTLIIPAAAMGSLSLSWDGATTKTMSAGTVTAASIAAALNAIVASGATAPRFRVEERPARDARRFAIEFIGALAGAAQSLLTVAAHDQEPLLYARGLVNLDGNLGIEQSLNGEASVTLKFELVINDADGPAKFVVPIELVNDMTNEGTIATLEQIGAVVTIIREVNVDAGLGTSFAETAAGIAFTGPLSAATNAFVFEHNLGEFGPMVDATYRISDDPEEWITLPDDRYEARSLTDNTTRITLPVAVDITDPNSPLYADRYKFYFSGRERQITLFEHGHTWAQVRETLPSGTTAAAKFAALDAAIAGLGGGAAIPGSSLNDGSVSPAKLDLTALSTSLFETAKMLELLRAFAADDAFVRNLIERLSESTSLAELRATLFTALLTETLTNTELQTALMQALTGCEDFADFIADAVVAALAGGAQPPGLVLSMPSTDLYLPAPTTMVLSGVTVTEYRGLPIAFQSTTSGGNVSGTLAAGTAGYLYTTTAAALAPETDARPAQSFATGKKLIWNGSFYQISTLHDTTRYYPSEFERTIIEAFLDDARFPASTLLTLKATLQTQLDSPDDARLRARWQLIIEVGTPTAESGELNLNAFTWQTGVTHTLQLGPELAITPLILTATRPASGAVTWALSINGRSAAFTLGTAVTTGNFAVRARLQKFDPENATDPRGAVRCKVLAPGGLISALTE